MSKNKKHKNRPDFKSDEKIDANAMPEVEEMITSAEEENEKKEAEIGNELEEKIASLSKELEEQKQQTEKEKKEYLFLMAEFDNFRKRTLREKSEIIKNAGEQVFKGLLPIVDDFERGIQASEKTDNAESIKEGMELIYNKLKKYLEQNGVKQIDPEEKDFDTEKHEAISALPVPDETQKGKILDTVEKGYMINDKVLRHAKVVVGQ